MSGAMVLGFCYVALAVFLVAFAARAIALARLPVHLRWELAPVPHEKGKNHYGGSYFEEYEWWTKPREKSLVAEGTFMFKEIVFLKGVWEHNRSLWKFSFPFHFGLYVLVVMSALLLFGGVLGLLGIEVAGLGVLVRVLALAGYFLGAVGVAGLFVTRVGSDDYRTYTTPAALLNLCYLFVVLASGFLAALVADRFDAQMLGFAGAFLTAGFSSVRIEALLGLHLTFALVFLAYLPFTRMMHFVAKYFTYHQVRWDDAPMDEAMASKVEVLLKQPVTWSAPHLKADGRKNWVDIATEEVDK